MRTLSGLQIQQFKGRQNRTTGAGAGTHISLATTLLACWDIASSQPSVEVGGTHNRDSVVQSHIDRLEQIIWRLVASPGVPHVCLHYIVLLLRPAYPSLQYVLLRRALQHLCSEHRRPGPRQSSCCWSCDYERVLMLIRARQSIRSFIFQEEATGLEGLSLGRQAVSNIFAHNVRVQRLAVGACSSVRLSDSLERKERRCFARQQP